jgi:RNA polymerase sigma factor for flagellar operon FliA
MLEIAGELGVTEPRISQLRAEALVLLRDRLDAAPRPLLQRAAETGSAVPSSA